MDKRNWKIIYTSYKGMEKKAVELINKEMGALILRDAGIYRIHVLPCEQVNNAVIDKNVVVVGLYDENEIIRKYIKKDEIKQDGYVVKVTNEGENKVVLITANDEAALFYGAVDFVDDYFAFAIPKDHYPIRLTDEIFDSELPDYYISSAPQIKTRNIFTWGHPITDYRNYIENMARLKLNQLIIWNDYVPLNAEDIVNYAHEYGIKVIWGFAWGWSRNCMDGEVNALEKLAETILENYKENYLNLPGDGIYFQSFTEVNVDRIGDKLIAEAVVDLVNMVSAEIYKISPDLLIQFGLHATSVKERLQFIDKVDKRVEIIWENCGAFPCSPTFPYWGDPMKVDDEEFEETIRFNDDIMALRDKGKIGILFKGFVTLDWCGDRFVHQKGPFVLGVSSERLKNHDKEMLKPIWRHFQTLYMKNGEYAYKMVKFIAEKRPDATVGVAAQLSGGIWFAHALVSQILWECDKPYDEIFKKVSLRRSVEIV